MRVLRLRLSQIWRAPAEIELPIGRLGLCWPSMSEEEMVLRIESGGTLYDGDLAYRRLHEPVIHNPELEGCEGCHC